MAEHVAAAAEGKLDKKVWAAARRAAEPRIAAAERAMARKDLLLYLPSAPLLAPLVNRARMTLAACDAAAGGGARPDAASAGFPDEDAITRVLVRIRLDALELYATATQDVLQRFTVLHDNRELRIQPMAPEVQGLVKRQADAIAGTWGPFQALPWGEPLPEHLVQFAEEMVRDVKALPSARTTGTAAAGAEKKDKGGEASPPAVILIPRLSETVGKLRDVVAGEKKKPGA